MASDVKYNHEGTRVDLGEDLLQSSDFDAADKLKNLNQKKLGASDTELISVKDELQHAQILMGERLFEEAKKIFRRIIRKNNDPNEAMVLEAQQKLEEIQRLELQELLKADSSRKKIKVQPDIEETSATIVERLERELDIQFEDEFLQPVPNLFLTDTDFQKYKEKILDIADQLSPRDKIDFGIAFLEMGLPVIAEEIFTILTRAEDYRVSGSYLLAISLIHSKKSIEATILLEPFVRDLNLDEKIKTDFLYLMALAFESLSDERKSREFFRRVYLLNPKYRDVVEKLK